MPAAYQPAESVRAALTELQRHALDVITEAEEAWVSLAALDVAGVHGSTLDELGALDLVVLWSVTDGGVREDLATLTPWGAHVLEVEIDERTEVDDGEELEIPFWVGHGKGSLCVVLPKHAHLYRSPFPEVVVDPAPGPEFLIDEVSGEPVQLWGRLIPLRSDRRRKGRPRRSA